MRLDVWTLILVSAMAAGCGGKQAQQREFFTSGNREADQRAEQRIAQVKQMRGEGETDKAGAPGRRPLFERLGGEAGIKAIVDDFVPRVLADPRVNWERKGEMKGGFLGMGKKPAEWKASDENVARLKKHFVQFLAVTTGGPTKYEGRDMGQVHKGMGVENSEFDAAVGDLKATLDKLGVATAEQKELLAILESTRPEVVEER